VANAAQQADQAAIDDVVAGLDDAWGRGDAEAFAARFAADGSFTNVLGMAYDGREAFRDRHDAIFKTIYKGSKSTLVIAKLRFIRPDVAIADVDAEMSGYATLPPGVRAGPDGIMRSKLQLVFVKESDTWWITAYHNVAVTPLLPRP
jgi:uncharacterized protein (TIGR02246 family)